jgi:hypothetical protein
MNIRRIITFTFCALRSRDRSALPTVKAVPFALLLCVSTVKAVTLQWLDGPPQTAVGVSWGVPWPKGQVKPGANFSLGNTPVQTWPLAYWPDGSLKWTGHAICAAPASLELLPGKPPTDALRVDGDTIDTGAVRCRLGRGSAFIESLNIGDREVARNGRLVALTGEAFTSQITNVTFEQTGPIRAVVKIEGVHASASRRWLPFTVRLYFYAGQPSLRLVHTFIFDGDDQKDFIRGLGLAFDVPLREQPHNRHVRFTGELPGLWSEPVQPLTGRRELLLDDKPVYPDQLAGQRVPNREEYDARGQALIADWAVWSDYKLVQNSADGFIIQKRTNPQSAWIDAGWGRRASGLAFVGDVTGGLGVGVRNFWQSYPAALEVHNAASPTAELRVWLWSPDAPAMDLRHYDTRAHGLEAAYEDIQPGFSTPYGIARTSELMLWPSADVPARKETVRQAQTTARPPLLVCSPQYCHSVGVFGAWSLPGRSKWIEDQLDAGLAHYQKEIEQRHWYGFWDYGDFMHTYDTDRHVWRYDIGGFAWANSELVPDLWLWYSFLRTGRADIFRMAEAMSRHTGEVDTYHIGRFAGLGSRHNVRHWGDGAKEARIGQAALRRVYYYLTTDERTGDLMREALQADASTVGVDPLRVAEPVSGYPEGYPTRARIGPDWLAYAGNWMTEWERTGDTRWRDKILAGVDCFAKMKHGLFTSKGVFFYDPKSNRLIPGPNDAPGAITLANLMGGPEVAFEMTELLDNPEWTKLWVQYCSLYGAPREEIEKAFGVSVSLGRLEPDFARLPAYAAKATNNPELARRAWVTFLRRNRSEIFPTHHVEGPEVLNPIDEVPRLSTNGSSQWSLNAIELLELVGDSLPENAK